MNGQDFHGVDDTLLGHLNHRKLPVVQNQVILALEVRLDVYRLLLSSGFVRQVDGVLTSIAIDQALDDEVGTQDRATTVVRLDLQLPKAAVDLVESRGLCGTSVTIFDGLQKGHELLPVTTIEDSHGSPHVGGTGPETSVRNIDVHNKPATL